MDNTCKHWIRSVCKTTWTLTATHLRRKKICLRDVNGAILCQFEESCSVDPLGQVGRTGNDKEHPEDGTVEDEKEPEDEEQRVCPVEHLQYDADFVRRKTDKCQSMFWQNVVKLLHSVSTGRECVFHVARVSGYMIISLCICYMYCLRTTK